MTPRFSIGAVFVLAIGLALIIPAELEAQAPPPPTPGDAPPPRPGEASPPPRSGEGPPPPRRDGPPPPRPGDGPPPPRPTAENPEVSYTVVAGTGSASIHGEVWVDNWFSLWVNGEKIIEDSVPITKERSFNAEDFTFRADPPFTFAFEFRDFTQNETGLEYIGTRRQQMGDGGAIAQFKHAETGALVAATDANWRCLVVQRAPLDEACVRDPNPRVGTGACDQQVTTAPQGWAQPTFDDRSWQNATVHSKAEVSPKGGYDQIRWDPSAQFIWGPDLKRDNILLCRVTVGG